MMTPERDFGALLAVYKRARDRFEAAAAEWEPCLGTEPGILEKRIAGRNCGEIASEVIAAERAMYAALDELYKALPFR